LTNNVGGSEDLTFFIMIINQYLTFTSISCKVENSLSNLFFSWNILFEAKLLSHLLNVEGLIVLFIFNCLMTLIWVNNNVWVIGYTLVDKSIRMSLKSLKHLLPNLLFPVNKIIVHSMVIVPHLSVLIINLNKFFKVILLIR